MTSFLHPASGVLVLVLDWLLFSGSALSLGLSTPFLAVLGFALGSLITARLQRQYGHDTIGMSWVKGLLAGLAVGVPWPIAGTAVGAWVLSLSGLDRLKRGRSPRSLPDDSDAA